MGNKLKNSSMFWQLLTWIYGQRSGEALIGDMQEEYTTRRQLNPFNARLWIVSQYSRTLASGISRQCTTPIGLSRIVLLATIVMLPLIVSVVAWLSNMDETTPELWAMVLAGEMHNAIFVSDFWQVQPQALSQIDSLHIFINVNSVIWALTSMALVILVGNKKSGTVGTGAIRLATALGIMLMMAPYLLSLVYLDLAQLPPKKIGPIIAFTLFNVFYMLPLMAWWLRRQAAKVAGG